MRIVSFKDGTYGIRKGWFPWTYKYVDLKSIRFTWSRDSCWFYDCKGSYEQVVAVYNYLTDNGAPLPAEEKEDKTNE